MSDRKVYVYVDLDGTLHHVGQLWTRSNRGKEGAKFFQISSAEIERMASAFEHQDLVEAIRL